jgi:hypothetical protein
MQEKSKKATWLFFVYFIDEKYWQFDGWSHLFLNAAMRELR